jgi:hypothetical protein
VALTPYSSKSGSATASTAAISSGSASAGAPAITRLMTIFSTVHSARIGGSRAITSSGKRLFCANTVRTRVSVGGISGRPSPQPFALAKAVKSAMSSSASWRVLASQLIWQPSGPQSRPTSAFGSGRFGWLGAMVTMLIRRRSSGHRF